MSRRRTIQPPNAQSRAKFRTGCAIILTLGVLPAAFGQQEDRSGSFSGSFTIRGTNTSTSGGSCGVWGRITAPTGESFGLYGTNSSTTGRGVYGWASAATGRTHGVYGRSDSNNGMGVLGLTTHPSGTNWAVAGENRSTNGRGVYGVATTLTGNNFGVYGRSHSATGTGVFGESMTGNGLAFGVYGKVHNNNASGVGVYGYAASGVGVRAESGANGVAAEFLGAAEFFTPGVSPGLIGRLWNFGATQYGRFELYNDDEFPGVQMIAEPDENSGGVFQLFDGTGASSDATHTLYMLGRKTNGAQGSRFVMLNGLGQENAETFRLDGNDGTGGSRLSVFNGQATNQETITLDADIPAYGGGSMLRIIAPNGQGRVHLAAGVGTTQASSTLRLYGSNGVSTPSVALEGGNEDPTQDNGGTWQLQNQIGNVTAQAFGGHAGAGATLRLFSGQAPQQETITLNANATTAGGNITVNSSVNGGRVVELWASDEGGNLAIWRKSNPDCESFRITYNGDIWTHGTVIPAGCDLAESFDLTARPDQTQPGSVMVMDAAAPGRLTVSAKAYDGLVAGIISGAGGLQPGIKLGAGRSDQSRDHSDQSRDREGAVGPLTDVRGSDRESSADRPIALSGRVYCLVDATEHAVAVGDMLTTSDTPGHAMKAADRERAFGAVIGKAMQPLEKGKKGLVLVLVSLQ